MKTVLWFSRHEMSKEQKEALGDVEVMQVSKTIETAFQLEYEIEQCDIIAIVAPINLQQQFLRLAEGKPVIMAKMDRELIKKEGGEDEVRMKFVKWEQLDKIIVEKHDFIVE